MKPDLPGFPTGSKERYEGRPLLLILEFYVLDCIGELDPEKQAFMCEWIRSAFGEEAGDDWKATIRGELRLAEAFDQALAGMWDEKRRLAAEAEIPLEPDVFAQMLVDQNFSRLIGPAES